MSLSPRGIAATVLAVTATLLATPPAQAAAPGGTVASPNGVLYPGCTQHPFSYALELPAGTTSWSADIDLIGPDGVSVTSDFLFSFEDPTTGVGDLQICQSELAGSYTLTGMVDYSTADSGGSFALPTSQFTMRRALTKTTLRASVRSADRGDVVKFKVSATDERPAGYFGEPYAKVQLQQRKGGRWVNLKGTRETTGATGRATIKVTLKTATVKVRARTVAEVDAYVGSVSRPVRVR